MIPFLKRSWPILLGGLLGYAYYAYIGCRFGSCPISGNPWTATGYGMLMGVIDGWKPKKRLPKDEVSQ